MGSISKITCSSCRKTWKCLNGCGLLHARLEDVIREFPEETGREIVMQTGAEDLPLFDFAYQSAVCTECSNMVGVPVLELSDGNKKHIGQCPVCGGGVQLITDLNDVSRTQSGKNIMKQIPAPPSLSADIVPPIDSTIVFTIDSPKPAPPISRERDLSTR